LKAIVNILTVFGTTAALVLFLVATPLHAQYTASYQTNIINGVTSNWVDNPFNPTAGFVVGSNLVYDALLIGGGGVLSNGNGSVGYGGNNNAVVVSDSGSVWNNNGALNVGNQADYNTLTVTNGGVVNSTAAGVGVGNGQGNAALVTGSGSVWNSGNLVVGVGNTSFGNLLAITQGGAVNSGGNAAVRWGEAVVTDTGSAWRISGGLGIGADGSAGLIVSNGGSVYCSSASLTADLEASALVTDTGSVWRVSGFLVVGGGGAHDSVSIANGGALSSGGGDVGRGCSVLVTGSGSIWSNSADLAMGLEGGSSSMTVINGGAVYNANANLSGGQFGSAVLVSGPGSLWNNSGNLSIGENTSMPNQLTVTDGGGVLASNVYAGGNGNGIQITVSGGALYVTNALGNGVLQLVGGTLALNGGTVTVDSLVASNSTPYGAPYGTVLTSTVSFTSGTLNTKATLVSNNLVFAVGDGTDAAALNLVSGGSGFHSFANGLTISSNATLNGVGTIIGATTVNSGGMLAPGDGPGSITFSNNLTLAAGSTFAVTLNGTGAGQYDQIIGLGPMSISNSVLRVSLGYTPSAGDSYTIISNFSDMAVLGTFVATDGLALPNGAEFQVDGTTFEIDYAANADGMDVMLMALIPEPSTWFLVAIGTSAVLGLRRRRQRPSSRAKSV
jgi:T5SS/PEP-CTERM-associated repeat protein